MEVFDWTSRGTCRSGLRISKSTFSQHIISEPSRINLNMAEPQVMLAHTTGIKVKKTMPVDFSSTGITGAFQHASHPA
ncbi:hypothetical protein Y1Q_0007375 [Alligator mississippiensis]|uniref:Uncharacterized protein n=1 Tax=Alligator mississippiensis TaxID=8496 RepID=A0A151P7K9_ALLMI|nr:hypothetical protein Y1Q_0007375 [Alligator mississippiensis]